MNEAIDITIQELENKARLDKILSKNLPDISRERIKKLILDGNITLQPEKIISQPSHKVSTGDIYNINIPAPISLEIKAEDIPIEILFEDKHLIVINKSAGISVHPSGHIVTGTLVNALLHHCKDELSGIGGVERPGIVHRLDKGTSGVMVVAKDDKTHQGLSKIFAERNLDRYYIAICYGAFRPTKGKIETLIGRHPKNRKKMAVLEDIDNEDATFVKNPRSNNHRSNNSSIFSNGKGKVAITNYELLKNHSKGELSLVQFKLETGRTHQIRVHSTHLGYPIAGDPMYGRRKKMSDSNLNDLIANLKYQMLHAKSLAFEHPITGEELSFETNPPKNMQDIVNYIK